MGSITTTARKRPKRVSISIAALLVVAPAAKSQTWNYGADVGVGVTDNIALVADDKVSQTIATADLDFAYKQQSLRLDTDVKGDFSYLYYLQHAYSGQLLGRFDGLAELAIVPERLTWTLQDNFGQALLNPFAVPIPTNLENVDYLLTGPNLKLPLGSSSFLDISAHYARAQYQTSPFDSNRALGSVEWGVQLSPLSTLALDALNEHVLFTDTMVNTDFQRSSVYGHYELHGARTQLVGILGATEVTQGGLSITRPLLRLAATRTLSPDAKLTLSAGEELTDAGASFSLLQSGAIGTIKTAPAPVTSASYTSFYTNVGWTYGRGRTGIAVSGQWEKDSYETQSSYDHRRSGGEFRIDRHVTRALTAEFQGSLTYTDYAQSDFTARDALLGAALILRQGRGLEYRLRYSHSSRVSTGVGSSYNENLAFLTIGYRPK
jgi:hypothetical protein